MEKAARPWKSILIAMAGVALVLMVPLLPDYAVTLATSIIIYSIYVTSAHLLTGTCLNQRRGLLGGSSGHADCGGME